MSRRVENKEKMKLITVHLPPAYIEGLKELVRMGRYPNVSEAIRAAVRDLLNRELWMNPANHMQPTVTLFTS